MISIKRTNSNDSAFQALVAELDKDLALKNGDTNDFFAQYNKTDAIAHVLLAYSDGVAVGCGAIKKWDSKVMEIKRMFVPTAKRGQGIAAIILIELQNWAKELGYEKCILETGNQNIEAIGLYKKHHFNIIPNYGQYVGVEDSICFEKRV